MLDWGLGFLDGLASFATDPAGTVAGWTFDKVTLGIYEWLARGLAVLIEWVWRVLDSGTTPRLSDDWFADGVFARVAALALAVVVAMMLATGIQAALAGRPELVLDAVREGARAIVASAVAVTVVDLAVGIVDEASAAVWQVGRDDLVTLLERMVRLTVETGLLGQTFIGPLCLLFGFVGLLGVAVSLLMRSALVYLVVALAPLVWSASVLPMMRDASRRLVHILVALVAAKLAIVVSLVVAVQLAASAGVGSGGSGSEGDVAQAAGTLVSGFACFLVAAVSPAVLYRLMPTVEGAVASSGIVGGWGRSAMGVAQAALMAHSAGAGVAALGVAGQSGVAGAGAGAATVSSAGGSGGAPSGGASRSTSAATGSASPGGNGQASDGNLPRLPDVGPGSEPDPVVPPGAPDENTGPGRRPSYGSYAAGGSDDGSPPNNGLPSLPPSPPRPSPWAIPGSPAGEGPPPTPGGGSEAEAGP